MPYCNCRISDHAWRSRSIALAMLFSLVSSVDLASATPPPNDECDSLWSSVGPNDQIQGTTVEATNDGVPACDPGGAASRDVWYFFEPMIGRPVSVRVFSSQIDPVVSIHNFLECNTALVCNDDCMPGTTAGAIEFLPTIDFYLIRVSDKGIGSGGTFTLVTMQGTGPVPANDYCANAAVIPGSATAFHPATYSTTAALWQCGELPESCDGSAGTSNTIWYQFTPDSDGVADIDTLGSDYDTVLSVFSGTCNAATEIACDDDGGGSAGPSVLQDVPMTANITYLIKVADWDIGMDGGILDFNFSFQPIAQPVHVPPVVISTLTHAHFFDGFFTITRDGVVFPCTNNACNGPGFSASIGQGDTVHVRFEAPKGMRFVVTHAPGGTQSFSYNARWTNGLGDSTSNFVATAATLENLSGTPPVSTFNQHGVFDAGNAFKANGTYTVTGNFSFTALDLEFPVTNAVADIMRTYGEVGSSSSPSFSSGRAVQGSATDTTIMRILPIEPADLNNDGVVGVPDLLAVINAWGACSEPCPPHCPADVTLDCTVGVPDLLAVINNWE